MRAVVWNAADDRDSDGIADGMHTGVSDPANNARLSDNSTAPNFASAAPLGNGIATVTGLRYDETGIVELSAVQTGDYLGIGAAATAAIRGLSGAVGRFHPARSGLPRAPAPPPPTRRRAPAVSG